MSEFYGDYDSERPAQVAFYICPTNFRIIQLIREN
jgi:hypothetical protein